MIYMCQGGKPDTGMLHSSYFAVNVCGAAYKNGCVVNGMCAMAAEYVFSVSKAGFDSVEPQVIPFSMSH